MGSKLFSFGKGGIILESLDRAPEEENRSSLKEMKERGSEEQSDRKVPGLHHLLQKRGNEEGAKRSGRELTLLGGNNVVYFAEICYFQIGVYKIL